MVFDDELRELPHAVRRRHDRHVGPNLDDLKPPYDVVVEQVTNGGGVMPPFGGTLTEQQIADVAAYVSSVAGT